MFKTDLLLLVSCFLAGLLANRVPAAQTAFRDNPEMYSDDDLNDGQLNVPELIERYGYPSESHQVKTSDGYILELHRIPYGLNQESRTVRPVVLVFHGILSSSADFVITGPGKALGYVLADSGFDVWLGNARGNFYSRQHVSLNPSSDAFWDFSWEEMGRFDLPAMTDYILETTGQSALHYVGHSQGTTAFFVLNSMIPEYNAKFSSAHLMAPIAYMKHFPTESLAILSNFIEIINGVGELLDITEIYPRGSIVYEDNTNDGEYKCLVTDITAIACDTMISVVEQANNTAAVGSFPAGSSFKQVAQYAQNIDDKKFQRWDYGSLSNLIHYGQLTPPIYDLSTVTAEVVLIYSEGDTLAGVEDVEEAAATLPNSSLRQVARTNFTHFDFAWAADAKELVYDFIVEYINDM